MSFSEWHSSESLCDTIGRIGVMCYFLVVAVYGFLGDRKTLGYFFP